MIDKIVSWAKSHKYLAIAAGVGIVVLLYILLHAGGKSNGPQTMAQQKLADQTQIDLAHIQAGAAETPYQQQTKQASIAAGAQTSQANTASKTQEALATTQANSQSALANIQAAVQQSGIAASLQQALASITGQETIASTQASAGEQDILDQNAGQLANINASNAGSLSIAQLESQLGSYATSLSYSLGLNSNADQLSYGQDQLAAQQQYDQESILAELGQGFQNDIASGEGMIGSNPSATAAGINEQQWGNGNFVNIEHELEILFDGQG